jgi:hypothetical protein
MNDLVPNEMYLLKWNSLKPDGTIHNMIILEGQFIKYFNRNYCEEYTNFLYDDTEAPPQLLGSILTETEDEIPYPFDDPLYPYAGFIRKKLEPFRPVTYMCNLGLFKILNIRKSIFKGIEKNFNGNNPYKFVTLNSNTVINTPRIIYGETLMWVNLDQVSIRPLINKLKLLQNKAVDTLPLPEDTQNQVKKLLGGKRTKKRKTKMRRKKTIKRKTK